MGREEDTVGTRIIGPCARTLELPLLVWSGVFFFFLLSQGADFWCVFRPFSGGGNFGLHSTWSDYSSSYGITMLAKLPCQAVPSRDQQFTGTIKCGFRPNMVHFIPGIGLIRAFSDVSIA